MSGPDIQVFTGPRLGRKKAADPRDRGYAALDHIEGLAQPKPRGGSYDNWTSDLPSLQRRHKAAPVLDQGNTSRCVAFAMAQLVLTGPTMQDVPGMDLGRFGRLQSTDPLVFDEELWRWYHWMQGNDEWQGGEPDYYGTSGRAGAKFLQEEKYISNYFWLQSIEEIARFIILYGPVPVGTDWFTGMDRKDTHGYIHAQGEWRGGHEYLLDEVDITRGYFGTPNSWGDWGRARITFSDMRYLLSQGGDAMAITEIRRK